MRVVALESTFHFAFGSRAYATGIPTILAGTPVLEAIEQDSVTGDELSGLTVQAHDVHTAVNIGDCDATAANGYEAGKVYSVVIDTGTVGGVSAVGEVVYEFRIETVAELAQREYAEKMFVGHVVSTTTGNTTGLVNLTEIVDANTAADDANGELLTWWDATDGVIRIIRVDDFAVTNLLATVTQLDGTALPAAVAAGDMLWRSGQFTANAVQMNEVPIVGAGTSADKWRA